MIAVIADDITGAAEIAGVCLRYGLKVSFGIDTIPNEVADVCVVATDSRSLSESEAYAVHSKLAVDIYKQNPTFVFKKCDSVLRGFVLTELSALLAESHLKRVLLQPANPSVGRCIKDGFYYVGDEKIEKSGFSIDPDFPTTDSSVLNILLQRSKKHENLNDIHVGHILKLTGNGIFIPDCNSIDDLKVSSLLAMDKTLLCGSAAFFEQILKDRGIKKQYIDTKVASVIYKNFLLVAGTTHSESKRFAEKLKQIDCPVIYFPDRFLEERLDESEFEVWFRQIEKSWNEKQMLSIGISDKLVDFPDSSTELKRRLSRAVAYLFDNCTVNELLIEGGATAYSVLKTLSLYSFTLDKELAPGVLRMKINTQDNCWLTIKPGSYPWP
jgi:uncharacterized protein YgbK (DUF1537 family)